MSEFDPIPGENSKFDPDVQEDVKVERWCTIIWEKNWIWTPGIEANECHNVDHGVLQDGSASRWKSLLDQAKFIGLEGKLRGHKIQSTLKSINNTMVETMQTTVESEIRR